MNSSPLAHVVLALEPVELARERRYYKIAERHYRAALEIAQKEENFENLADRRGNLGELALVRKNYTGARMWLEQALPLAQTVGRQDLIGTHKYWLA